VEVVPVDGCNEDAIFSKVDDKCTCVLRSWLKNFWFVMLSVLKTIENRFTRWLMD